MIDFTKMNGTIVADNKVSIGGLEFMLTDDECIKVRDIINGLISTRNTTNSLAPATTTPTSTKSTKSTTTSTTTLPEIGDVTYKFDYATVFKSKVRITNNVNEKNSFIPKPIFNGVSQSLRAAGAKWSKDTQSWEFQTIKACNDWCKAQKEYEKARKAK